MRDILLSPPVAFLIYVVLAGALTMAGSRVAPVGEAAPGKRASYASGEAAPSAGAAPGYRPFFVIALFFAMAHLGVLVAGSGGMSLFVGVYLGGLILALIALILG